VADIRQADVSRHLDDVERLWLEYLTWGNDGLEARYGFRLPVREAVEHDLETISKFAPPAGRLLLGFEDGAAVGIGCMRRIGPATAEIKRMYVEPSHRGAGLGRALLDALLTAAQAAGYQRIKLDSPDFMTAAHALYRSAGFVEIEPYPESEIPRPAQAPLGVHGAGVRRAVPCGGVSRGRPTPALRPVAGRR
jgi:GNAT superfamily N-acetyltransferase